MVNKPWRTIRCRSCGSEYGWNGSYLDMPSCPHCGYELPESKKEGFQKKFDDMLKRAQTSPARRRKPSSNKQKEEGKKQAKRRKKRK